MPNRPGNDDRTTAGGMGDGQSTRDEANGATPPTRGRSNRGFASMDRSKQKEIASKGGRAAHAKGTAHEFDSGEARDAGRKGGVAVSRNREHMAAIGRRGGEARGHARGNASVQASAAGAGSSMGAPERQVAIDNQKDGVATRPVGGSSSTPERRPMGHANDIARSDENFDRG